MMHWKYEFLETMQYQWRIIYYRKLFRVVINRGLTHTHRHSPTLTHTQPEKGHTHPHATIPSQKRWHPSTPTHTQPEKGHTHPHPSTPSQIKVTLTHTHPYTAKKRSHSSTHTHTQPKKGHTHPHPPTPRKKDDLIQKKHRIMKEDKNISHIFHFYLWIFWYVVS